jgi:archaetidylinositol phosphate synthase
LPDEPGPHEPGPHRSWSDQHDGLTASPFVAGWLRAVDGLAAPLVRARVHPDVVTAAGLAVVAGAVVAAASGRPALAGVGVLASGLVDGLDGAVARRGGRGAPHGAALDRSADRLGEAGFAAVLGLAGAPWPVALGALALGWGAEGWRSARRRAGRPGLPATVGERPTRVLVVGMFTLAAGVVDDDAWAAAGAWVWLGTGVVAAGQLAAARSRGRDPRVRRDPPGR